MLENMTKKVTLEKVIEAGTELKIWERNHQNSKGRIEKSKLNIDEKTDYLFLKGLYQKLLRSYKKQLESKVEQDSDDTVKEQKAEVKELKVKLANIADKNETISQKLKETEGQKEILQGQQKRILEVFGDRMNKWKNDPRKKWQYEAVKEMGEDIGIKVSSEK